MSVAAVRFHCLACLPVDGTPDAPILDQRIQAWVGQFPPRAYIANPCCRGCAKEVSLLSVNGINVAVAVLRAQILKTDSVARGRLYGIQMVHSISKKDWDAFLALVGHPSFTDVPAMYFRSAFAETQKTEAVDIGLIVSIKGRNWELARNILERAGDQLKSPCMGFCLASLVEENQWGLAEALVNTLIHRNRMRLISTRRLEFVIRKALTDGKWRLFNLVLTFGSVDLENLTSLFQEAVENRRLDIVEQLAQISRYKKVPEAVLRPLFTGAAAAAEEQGKDKMAASLRSKLASFLPQTE